MDAAGGWGFVCCFVRFLACGAGCGAFVEFGTGRCRLPPYDSIGHMGEILCAFRFHRCYCFETRGNEEGAFISAAAAGSLPPP